MDLKDFVRFITPYFVRVVYKSAYRFYYRTIGTLYRKGKSNQITSARFLKLMGFKTATELVSYFKGRKTPTFFMLPESSNVQVNSIRKCFPNSVNSTVNSAEKIVGHIFDLLGSGEINLGSKIDWHFDFKVNRQWSIIHPKGINVNELNKASDIKVPWELSRCQHFITLGKAYWYTKDERYSKEFLSQIESWIKGNPYCLGINWFCTMDVAIRACNWVYGWYFFKDSHLLDEKFVFEFIKSLYQHGVHIIGNLENKGGVTSNHYISDICGLLYLGYYFKNTRQGQEWRNFAVSELISEMQKQINPDGMDFEGSTCYHRLVLELFFFSTLLATKNADLFANDYEKTARRLFGDDYVDRFYKMFEFVLYVLKPKGTMPQIGDNDNGRLHIFSVKEILDMRYLLNYGTIFFKEPKFKIQEFGLTEDAIWVFGEEGVKTWADLPDNSINNLKSKAFPNSSIYVMRGKDVYLIIRSAPNGQSGHGGHNHNDVFSFELSIGGNDIIIDPGTYIYTGDYKMRNLFRSSGYHNTVTIDGREINEFNEKKVFHMKHEVKPEVLKWESNENRDIFEAAHYGYERLKEPVIHSREIIYHKKNNRIKIKDMFEGMGKHRIQWNLILSPVQAGLTLHSNELQWHKEDTQYSSEYGVITKTKRLTSIIETTFPFQSEFEIFLSFKKLIDLKNHRL